MNDDSHGKCQGTPPNPSVTEGSGYPRVSFNSDCSCWRPHPNKVKIPGQDPLQKRIDSAIKELVQFGMGLAKQHHQFRLRPHETLSLQELENDPEYQKLLHIIKILSGENETTNSEEQI